MFTKSALIYDAVFSAKGKDWADEARKLSALVKRHKRSPGNTMLDVACGNGGHVGYLCDEFAITGLDLDPGMLKLAEERFPGIPFHCASMVDFKLEKKFDIVMCLTSAIGYAKTLQSMRQAIRTMSDHVLPGGILVVEPWIDMKEYKPHTVHASYVDQPDLKVARINTNVLRGNISVLEFHYLVGTPEGVEHFTELHELGLYSHEEYQEAFTACGLDTRFEKEGLIGRGAYVGVHA
jgi:SAM-dependent methyltransferase